MLSEQRELLELIAERLNLGGTQASIALQFGVSKVKISRIVKSGIKEGLFHKALGVYSHCFQRPSWILTLATREAPLNISKMRPKPDIIYSSIFPTPTFIAYFFRTSTPIINRSAFRIIEHSRIIESFIVYELPSSRRLRLRACNECHLYDDIDELLMLTILKNLHLARYEMNLSALKSGSGLINIYSVKYHYYNHLLNNLVFRRYIIRPKNSIRVVIKVLSPSMAKAISYLLKLYGEGVLVGIDTFDIVYRDPFRAYIVAWINPVSAWSKLHNLEQPRYVKVEIFPVKLVYPVQEQL